MAGIKNEMIKYDYIFFIRRAICAIILFFVVNGFLFAQEKQLTFTRYNARNGLINNYVTCILQDDRGILWIATRSGVSAFDGYHFKSYVNDEEKPGTIKVGRITDMKEDNRGNIWFSSLGGGMDQYIKDKDYFIHFEPEPGNPNCLINKDVSNLAFDKEGNLIINNNAGNSRGTLRYNSITKVFDDFRIKLEVAASKIEEEVELYLGWALTGRDGKLWFGARNGLYSYDQITGKMQAYKYNENEDDPLGITPLCEDSRGNIWGRIGNGDGLAVLNKKTDKFKTYLHDPNNPKSLSNKMVNHIYEDSKNNLWIATSEGLNLFNREKEEFIRYYHDPRQDKSISDNTITYICEDNNGNLWFGTRLGLNKLNNLKFMHYYRGQSENSIVHNNIHAFCETSDKKIWIGTSKGVEVYDLETQLFMRDLNKIPEELTKYPALHMMADHNENIWVSLWSGGLIRYDRSINRVYRYFPNPEDPQNYTSFHTFYAYEDSKNRVWTATWGKGVELYNPKSDNFTHFDLAAKTGEAGNNYVTCLIEANNKLMAGTGQGIVEIDDINNKTHKNYLLIDKATNDTATGSFISCFYKTKKGELLMGSNYGIYKWDFKGKGVYRLGASDLLSGNIASMLEDEQNNLWVSTGKGLSRLSGVFTDDSVTVMNYKVEDGLQGEDFLERSCLFAKDGTMYFGGTNGLNKFRPEKVATNTIPPQVAITKIQLFNKEINTGDTINGQVVLTEPVLAMDELNLSYKNNFLTIEFAALHFLLPEKNKYEYMLEGFDKEWTATDATRRYATYTDLKGGEYLFKVRAASADGIWNKEPKTLKIIVTPPFWKTKWFITTVIAIIAALIYFLVKRREKQMLRDKMILQEQLQKGEREIENQRGEMQKQSEELRRREEEERDMKWYNEGLALFADVISRNKGELKKLTQSIISNLIEYVEAEQGAIYILNDDEEEPYLKLSASYGLNIKKIEASEKVLIGESLVGACFKDKEVKQVDDVPEGYTKINIETAVKTPNYLALVPIRLDETAVGVIELASVKKLEDIKISFLEKFAESVTSIIATEKANDKMQVVLEKSKLQANKMQEQEEEMRQNIEELRAQQEETARREDKLNKEKKEVEEQVNKLLKEINELEDNNK